MGPLQQYLNDPLYKWAPNNNIDPGGLSPFNLIFANEFKHITRVKLRGFILKVASSGRHVTFL